MPKLEEFSFSESFPSSLTTQAKALGSKISFYIGSQNLVLYAGRKPWRREICFWSNDVNRPVVGGNYSVRVRKKQNLKGNERGV